MLLEKYALSFRAALKGVAAMLYCAAGSAPKCVLSARNAEHMRGDCDLVAEY
jgi:hypothetical protein